MKKKIWFKKILWSYYPCHINGWISMFVLFLSGFILFFLSQIFSANTGYPFRDFIPPIVILIAISGWILAETHSE